MIVRSTRVVLPDGTWAAAVAVEGGRVAAVLPYESAADVDHGDLVISPGVVDTHVHVNEPGRTAWEGFATATAAAACGGVTTIVDMPLNSIPPTTTLAHLTAKRDAATAAGCAIDVGFWGGIVPGGVAEQAVLYEAGVFGFKAFLSPSGVEEFPHVGESALEIALAENARLGALTVVHAESPPVLDAAPPCAGPAYRSWLESRPPAAEVAAIEGLARLAARTGARAHVLHLSAADALTALDGLTAETCPHYLTLASDEVPDGGTAFKCAPPVRDPANRERLWEALAAGAFAGVVSDHSPATADLKLTGDFGTAWGGIASLQLGLPLMWTGARARGHTPDDLARWMSSGPADLVGLVTKGRIAPGRDADLVVWDPDATFVVDPDVLHHRNPVTPYAGRTLAGVVTATYLRGERIAADGQLTGARRGRLVERGAA